MKKMTIVVCVLLFGCSKGPDRQEFQRHLDAQGGWYDIQWKQRDGGILSVEVKHDVENATYRFTLIQSSRGISESVHIAGDGTTLWTRDTHTKERGFTDKMPPLPSTKRQLERLADQLFDAFCGGDVP